MAPGLFATKSVAELSGSPQQLKHALSVVSLTAFGIGSIIGTGIFVLTGTAAANHAARGGLGPAQNPAGAVLEYGRGHCA